MSETKEGSVQMPNWRTSLNSILGRLDDDVAKELMRQVESLELEIKTFARVSGIGRTRLLKI